MELDAKKFLKRNNVPEKRPTVVNIDRVRKIESYDIRKFMRPENRNRVIVDE